MFRYHAPETARPAQMALICLLPVTLNQDSEHCNGHIDGHWSLFTNPLLHIADAAGHCARAIIRLTHKISQKDINNYCTERCSIAFDCSVESNNFVNHLVCRTVSNTHTDLFVVSILTTVNNNSTLFRFIGDCTN